MDYSTYKNTPSAAFGYKINKSKTRLLVRITGFSMFYRALVQGNYRNRIISMPIPPNWGELSEQDKEEEIEYTIWAQGDEPSPDPPLYRIVRRGYVVE